MFAHFCGVIGWLISSWQHRNTEQGPPVEVVRRIAELVGISSRTWGTADSYYLRVMGTVLALTLTLFLSDAGGGANPRLCVWERGHSQLNSVIDPN